jgi:hypothetical protein
MDPLKETMKKTKSRQCLYPSCNEVSRSFCEKCKQPSCKYHMCTRTNNSKKVMICDKCYYSEIREQIEMENQKEKKNYQDKLNSINDKNNECIYQAAIDDQTLESLEEKIRVLKLDYELQHEGKIEEIRKEQFLKDKNLQMLANLKAAIDSSTEIYNTENEKLVKTKSDVSILQIDVSQVYSSIHDLESRISYLKTQYQDSITAEKFMELVCKKCFARVRGISFLKSEIYTKSIHKEKACVRCLIT